jgi:hypothetical protein
LAAKPVIVRTYHGTQGSASAAFRRDAENLAKQGYVPVSQVWAPGSWGCGAFAVALLLCLLIIGIFIFIYMLIVKPGGVLTVTYQYQPATVSAS